MKRLFSGALALIFTIFFAGPAGAAPANPASERMLRAQGIYFVETGLSCQGGGSLPTGGGTSLEGHTLPASTGGSVMEEEAVRGSNGVVKLKRTGGKLALGDISGITDEDIRFYMNMRWRYAKWAWSGGDTQEGPEDGSWYREKVRKVLISNPKTGKSVVAAVLEAGPAPWSGTPGGSATRHDPPDYWEGYVDGTPEGYDGRVAGLSPEAFRALGDNDMQWERGGADGYALNYQWAPDQNMVSGTIGTAASSSNTSTSSCASGPELGAGEIVYYSQYDKKWRDHPYGTSSIGPSGCGPTSIAMVVATLKGDASVTPVEVADFGTANNTYSEGTGTSWRLMEIGPENWGLKSTSIGTDINKAIDTIKNGGLVIASGRGPVPFTDVGHFIVIRSVTADGKLMIGDPADPDHKDANITPYDQSALMQSVRNMWAITK